MLLFFVAAVSSISVKTTPPISKKSPRGDKKFTKSVDLYSQESMGDNDSEDELVAAVPKIRRFTLADPLMMSVT